MKKAQEVRKKWQEKNNSSINQQAQELFDWVLDLIDENISNGYLGPLTLSLRDDDYSIRTVSHEPSFSLHNFSSCYGSNANRMDLFQQFQKIVEQEEGYNIFLNTSFSEKTHKEIVTTISIVS